MAAKELKKSETKVVQIQNFKSIKDVKFKSSRVNIFIGKPNSGKSNLLEALTLFNVIPAKNTNTQGYQFIRYNTIENLFYDTDLQNSIQIKLGENLIELRYYSQVDIFLQIVNPTKQYQTLKNRIFDLGLSVNQILKDFQIISSKPEHLLFSPKIASVSNSGNVSEIINYGNQVNPVRKYEFREGFFYKDSFQGYLKPFGENLYTIAQRYPAIRDWISSFFSQFELEFLFDFSSKSFEVQKKQQGIVYKIPFELTPDTFRRMLFHISAIYSSKNSTILFEEPESHSFPPYIKELSELIKADDTNHYFLTTHSPYFFNSFVEDSLKYPDISFFHVYYEDFQTKVKKLSQSDLDVLWGSGADVFSNIDSLNK